ncbi:MAG: Gfo/Idh/MocA family oxidoreductase [Patescibacteria group bacterium]
MKNIYIIGAGQLGSRHLQALKNVKTPLNITVVDPFPASLETAKERYDLIPDGDVKHSIKYLNKINNELEEIDIAIIPTSSNVRRQVVEELLRNKTVKHFILEKLLFQKFEDYAVVGKLLKKKKSIAWVNCSMRSMPFYFNIKKTLSNSLITYSVTGSQYGLITNAIHYIDHMAFLSDCTDYKIETSGLTKKPIESKRKGFLEFNGTINIIFKNGSSGSFTCFPEGELPVVVEITSDKCRCVSKESEQKAWISREKDGWQWKEIEAPIPFQSERTAQIVEDLLKNGKCILPKFDESAKLHLLLLEPLRNFLNKNSKDKFDYYPFT